MTDDRPLWQRSQTLDYRVWLGVNGLLTGMVGWGYAFDLVGIRRVWVGYFNRLIMEEVFWGFVGRGFGVGVSCSVRGGYWYVAFVQAY